MDEKEQQEWKLEDIMKEFSETDGEPETEDISREVEKMEAFLKGEEAPGNPAEESEPVEEQQPAEAPEAAGEPARAVTGDTIRLDTLPGTRNGEETQAEAPETPEAPETDKVEPYSEEWEPEYEQPIADYIPPRPIVFQPRSRLSELKRKLVEGPEKRYYELTELGIGKLQALIFLSLLVFALSAGATALYATGHVSAGRIKLMVFLQFFALLVSALLGCQQMIRGAADLLHKRFSLNTMLAFTFAVCCADGIFCLRELRIPCCAAFCLQVTMALWADYHRRSAQLGQMDTMRKAIRLDSIVSEPEYYQNQPGLLRGEGQVEDFMDTCDEPWGVERVQSVYALAALLISIAAGVTAGALHHSASFGVQVTATSLLAAVPVTAFITTTRPMAVLEKRLHAVGTVLCGWRGVRGMCGAAVFPVSHGDLFPVGSCNLNGVKFYGSRQPDEVVAYAAALIMADAGGLEPLFEYLLDSRNGRHYDVENLQTYAGGIGGEIGGESVLVGTPTFLKDMGVEIPQGTRVSQAVYAAIDGELCGLFAVTYQKDKMAAAGLGSLCGYRKLRPVLISGDFMLTESFIRSRFGINTRKMVFPERAVRRELASREPGKDAPALALITGSGLAPFAYAVTGARALHTACVLGTVIQLLGGIVGLVMMLVLGILGAGQLLTPANMLLYELIWMIPGLLITEWTRSI